MVRGARGAAVVLWAMAFAVLLGAAFPAGAGHADQTDPNDVGGPLDVRAVRLGHDDTPPVWTVVTFRRWTLRDVWDRGFVVVLLDTRGDPRAEYYALVRSDGRRLVGELFRDRWNAPDVRIGPLRAWRPGGRSVAVTVPLGRLAFGVARTWYGWSVRSLFTGPVCPRTCVDAVPDAGQLTQPLGSPSPTGTATPTPTPTPSFTATPTPTSGP